MPARAPGVVAPFAQCEILADTGGPVGNCVSGLTARDLVTAAPMARSSAPPLPTSASSSPVPRKFALPMLLAAVFSPASKPVIWESSMPSNNLRLPSDRLSQLWLTIVSPVTVSRRTPRPPALRLSES